MTASVWRLPRGDEGYPAPLQDLDEPPAALHGIGDAGLVSGIGRNTAVTIVGSRNPSSYGLEVAEELGYLLAGAGLVVVSGMALGIDAAAHRGALEAAGPTIAVLGSGPDVVYPRSERRLYERITSAGAVVSEMPPGTVPGPGCFPKRNRIMAAKPAQRTASFCAPRIAELAQSATPDRADRDSVTALSQRRLQQAQVA